jgi:hypothetical protein
VREREARRRLQAQRRRAGLLRSRIVAISLIAFALLWGAIFVQMATGNDPVLGASPAANRASTAKRAAPEAIEPTPPEELEQEFVEPEPVEEEFIEPEPEPAPVTTSQS